MHLYKFVLFKSKTFISVVSIALFKTHKRIQLRASYLQTVIYQIENCHYYTIHTKLHREDCLPSYCSKNRKEWYKNDKVHRFLHPAIVDENFFATFKNGKLHSYKDFPSYEGLNGVRKWHNKGNLYKTRIIWYNKETIEVERN